MGRGDTYNSADAFSNSFFSQESPRSSKAKFDYAYSDVVHIEIIGNVCMVVYYNTIILCAVLFQYGGSLF